MSSLENRRRARLASGVTLEYVERGRGTPIVFLHGVTDSWFSFSEVLECLPEGIRGIALTQRGHGGSDRPGSYRIEDFAGDVVAFLDALGLERVALVGHSMGSLVAQEVALARPDRVSHLVLAGASSCYDNPSVTGFHEAVRELRDPVPREFAMDFQVSTIHRPIDAALLERFVDESMKLPASVWHGAFEMIVAYRSTERLPRLPMPVLVVWADRDEIAICEHQKILVDAIPGAKLVVYEGVGHALHWEEPRRFAEDVVAFVRAKQEIAA
jgi:non-heme chloroperoxidase